MKQIKYILGFILLLAISGTVLFFSSNPSSALQSSDEEQTSLYDMYLDWCDRHGKDTDDYRFSVFQKAHKFIEEHNSQNDNLKLKLTHFADITNEEFNQKQFTEREYDEAHQVPEQLENTDGNRRLTSHADVDWVTSGYVNAVDQQGSCNSCWAQAAASAMEAAYKLDKGGSLKKFSRQQLVDCSWSTQGCNGGWDHYAYNYMKNDGPIEESNYGYTNSKGTCKDQQYTQLNWNTTGYGSCYSNQQTDCMHSQLLIQPLTVQVDASSSIFQYYSSGIITSSSCGTSVNHVVTLVGYKNSDYSWKIKNSWGTSWGINGYAWIFRQDTALGICGLNDYVKWPKY